MKCGSTLWLRQMAERGGHRGISRTEGAGLAERRDGRAEPDVHRSPSRMAPSPAGVGRSVTPSLLGGNGPLAPIIHSASTHLLFQKLPGKGLGMGKSRSQIMVPPFPNCLPSTPVFR